MATIIAFKARPEKEMNGQGIITWYTENGYLSDFLQAYATDGFGEMVYNKESRLYEIRFTSNESWPKKIHDQANEADIYLGNPDDDGNYMIDGYVVEGEIHTINGENVRPYIMY
jgi:hypothetical protein